MAEEGLDQTAVTVVLREEGSVLGAEVVALLGLDSDLAFKLANVFCCKL